MFKKILLQNSVLSDHKNFLKEQIFSTPLLNSCQSSGPGGGRGGDVSDCAHVRTTWKPW